jgi:hypothetical protein
VHKRVAAKAQIGKSRLASWSADYIQMPESTRRHTHVFTIIDRFSKYAFAYIMPGQGESASSTIKALEAWLAHLESMEEGSSKLVRRLQTDNGSAWLSGAVSDYLIQKDIRHVRSTPHVATSQGQIERFNSSLRGWLTSYAAAHGGERRWEAGLPIALRTYNSTVSRVTRRQPKYVAFNKIDEADHAVVEQRLKDVAAKRLSTKRSQGGLENGQWVRVSLRRIGRPGMKDPERFKNNSRKGSEQNWGSEVYKVIERRGDDYKLAHKDGTPLTIAQANPGGGSTERKPWINISDLLKIPGPDVRNVYATSDAPSTTQAPGTKRPREEDPPIASRRAQKELRSHLAAGVREQPVTGKRQRKSVQKLDI